MEEQRPIDRYVGANDAHAHFHNGPYSYINVRSWDVEEREFNTMQTLYISHA